MVGVEAQANSVAAARGGEAATVGYGNTMTPKIRIEDVSYAYGGVPALRNITLDVPDEAISVWFGPAGSGRTTLLRLINRL
ncbi:MAG: hypothetical protein JSW37_13540, partial [Anaerolineales bacterium]